MPTEVQAPFSHGSPSSTGQESSCTQTTARRHGVVVSRRLPTESILVSSTSPRRNRKRNVRFSAELLLETAVRDGDLGEARKLINAIGRDALNQPCVTSGVTFLHQSALNCDADMTQLLLDAGGFLECRDVDGWTPLQAAAAMGADACLKVLLDAGADPYSKTLDSQETAMDLVDVEDRCSVRCIKHLVAAMQKSTPYHRAVVRTRDSIASFSSVSTCSSFASAGSGGCPSPHLTIRHHSRSPSQDSGFDSICSSEYRASPSGPSPLTQRVVREQSRLCSAIESLSMSDEDTSSDEFTRQGDSNCPSKGLQVTDSDSDSDLESDGRGSVMASWCDESIASPTESQTGLPTLPLDSPSSGQLTEDVHMVLSTGSVARNRRRSSQISLGAGCSDSLQQTPHRRLTFV